MTLFKIFIIFNNQTYCTVQSYIHSFFAIRRGLPSWILLHFVLSYFLFRGMVQNGIPSVSFYFCSTDPSFEFISLPRKGSERNSETFLLFLFHRTEFRVVFLFRGGFGTEFREFLFCGTAGIPSEITSSSVNSVFRGIIFLSEIPNPITNSFQHFPARMAKTFGRWIKKVGPSANIASLIPFNQNKAKFLKPYHF